MLEMITISVPTTRLPGSQQMSGSSMFLTSRHNLQSSETQTFCSLLMDRIASFRTLRSPSRGPNSIFFPTVVSCRIASRFNLCLLVSQQQAQHHSDRASVVHPGLNQPEDPRS